MFSAWVPLVRTIAAAFLLGAFPFAGTAAPLLVTDVADVNLPSGSPSDTPATFRVAATGQGALAYQWFRLEQYFQPKKPNSSARVKLNGQTTSELTVTNWAGAKGASLGAYTLYSYYVAVTDGTGTIESSTRRVSVLPVLPPFAPTLMGRLYLDAFTRLPAVFGH